MNFYIGLVFGFIIGICLGLIFGVFIASTQYGKVIPGAMPALDLEREHTGFCEQHMVQIDFVENYNGAHMDPIQLPIANESYQITSGNHTIMGDTDKNGTLVAPLCSSVKYRIDILHRTRWLYPIDNYYRVML
jgi:hypothetical protein